MKSTLLLILLFFILYPSKVIGQDQSSAFDSYYIKPFGIYDLGFYFPQENDPLQFRESNYFITFGIDAGLAKSNNYALGISIAVGNEYGESDRELLLGNRNYESYLRLLINAKKSLIRTRANSRFQAALGISTAGGYVRFQGLEGTGETFYDPEIQRDRFLTKNVVEHAAYTSGGLYVEVGGKISNRVSIGLNYHLIEASISTSHYGFNVLKTGLILRF